MRLNVWVCCCLQVLKFMHRNNIVHRDVKPDNFCLPYGVDPLRPTKVETVYIVDMGMGYECKPGECCCRLCEVCRIPG